MLEAPPPRGLPRPMSPRSCFAPPGEPGKMLSESIRSDPARKFLRGSQQAITFTPSEPPLGNGLFAPDCPRGPCLSPAGICIRNRSPFILAPGSSSIRRCARLPVRKQHAEAAGTAFPNPEVVIGPDTR